MCPAIAQAEPDFKSGAAPAEPDFGSTPAASSTPADDTSWEPVPDSADEQAAIPVVRVEVGAEAEELFYSLGNIVDLFTFAAQTVYRWRMPRGNQPAILPPPDRDIPHRPMWRESTILRFAEERGYDVDPKRLAAVRRKIKTPPKRSRGPAAAARRAIEAATRRVARVEEQVEAAKARAASLEDDLKAARDELEQAREAAR